MKYITLLITLLSLSAPVSQAVANDSLGQCAANLTTITDANRKFAVTQEDTSKPVSFDDIGCAIRYRDKQCTTRQMIFDGSVSVYDFNSGEKLSINDAYFVHTDSLVTPKNYGIAAFKNEASAKRFVADNAGKVLSFDELIGLDLQ